jgi:hypothetical protein
VTRVGNVIARQDAGENRDRDEPATRRKTLEAVLGIMTDTVGWKKRSEVEFAIRDGD